MKKIIFSLLLCLCLSNLAIALNVTLEIQNSFMVGDEIQFEYTISSPYSQEVMCQPYVICQEAPIGISQEKTIQLQSNEPFVGIYSDQVVQDWFEPQDCTAYVQILFPVKLKEEKTFRIETDPSFEFSLFLCKNESCSEKSTIFVQNENIFFDFESSIKNSTIKITLIFPDDSQQKSSLPSSITASQIGTYSLEATASKNGYKTITKSIEFVVLEHEPNIPFAGECNANEVCDSGENSQNCPQDCVKETNSSEEGIDLTLIIIGILAVAIIGFLLFKKFK